MFKIIKKLIRLSKAPFVMKDFLSFKEGGGARFKINFRDVYPCLLDKTIKTGFDRHYIYHTSWAARKVKEINPKKHIDISSSLYFTGIVSAFVPVEFYDYRPADLALSGLDCRQGDLLSLPFSDNSINSLSCMHVVEHVGLGRYGDEINPEADLLAIKELIRVMAPGGTLLFVVPIGKEAIIEFNAHRIYTYSMIREYFKEMDLVEFSLIPERDGGMIYDASESDIVDKYACGCFMFLKK